MSIWKTGLCLGAVAVLVSACGSTVPLTATAQWREHDVHVGNGKISYSLPGGGQSRKSVFSPTISTNGIHEAVAYAPYDYGDDDGKPHFDLRLYAMTLPDDECGLGPEELRQAREDLLKRSGVAAAVEVVQTAYGAGLHVRFFYARHSTLLIRERYEVPLAGRERLIIVAEYDPYQSQNDPMWLGERRDILKRVFDSVRVTGDAAASAQDAPDAGE